MISLSRYLDRYVWEITSSHLDFSALRLKNRSQQLAFVQENMEGISRFIVHHSLYLIFQFMQIIMQLIIQFIIQFMMQFTIKLIICFIIQFIVHQSRLSGVRGGQSCGLGLHRHHPHPPVSLSPHLGHDPLQCPGDAGALPAQGWTQRIDKKKKLILSLSQCNPGSSEQLVPKTFLAVIFLSSPLKGFFGAIANVHLGCSNNRSSGTEPSRVQSGQESLEASEALCEICGFALWVENQSFPPHTCPGQLCSQSRTVPMAESRWGL